MTGSSQPYARVLSLGLLVASSLPFGSYTVQYRSSAVVRKNEQSRVAPLNNRAVGRIRYTVPDTTGTVRTASHKEHQGSKNEQTTRALRSLLSVVRSALNYDNDRGATMRRKNAILLATVRSTLVCVSIIFALFQIYTFERELAPRITRGEIAQARKRKISSTAMESTPVPALPRIVRPRPLPPLTSLLHINRTTKETAIVGNVTWLLDFAIIGFGKCGTSTMMEYLNQPPLSTVFQRERCDVGYGHPEQIIQDLYRVARHYEANNTLIGLKCPRNVDDEMTHYSAIFSQTKLIVGLRHPIHWFQSLYNFRVNNEGAIPHPNELIANHVPGAKGVFADRARYHFYLARLGKTPLKDDRELSILFSVSKLQERANFFRNFLIENVGQKVFLYHVEQLSNDTWSKTFGQDISNFLGLDRALPPVIHRRVPGRKFMSEEAQATRAALKINICDAEFKHLRDVLIDHGLTAAQWFREYFLQSPDVMVSSRRYFDWLMDRWASDPCETMQ